MLLGALSAASVGALALGTLGVGSREPLGRGAQVTALAAALAVLAVAAWGLGGAGTVIVRGPDGPLSPILPSLRFDAVTAVVLSLVALIGVVVTRYSRRYLDGAPGQARYARAMLATLASVVALVLSNSLLFVGLAWVGASLGLHQLLTFFPERPRAMAAAQKKFVFSRVADLCLAVATGIVGVSVHDLELDAIYAWSAQAPELDLAMQVATVLFVVGAALKCAQLPFHGWLVQVMEAPTPVSALLHAGVVNIGGFLMIRLAPLMAHADVAQTVLLGIGIATTVSAALVMSAQTSVKVTLAWSTAAQMGFMLVQCALGAYSLALLHLVAHSLYKAHAFLSSGSAVEQRRVASLRPSPAPARLRDWIGALAVGGLVVTLVALALGVEPTEEPALLAFGLVLSMAIAPLVLAERGRGATRVGLTTALGVGVVALYFGWHLSFGALVDAPAVPLERLAPRLAIAAAGFATLLGLQLALLLRPRGALALALEPRLAAGLHLDELLTRALLRRGAPRSGTRDEPIKAEIAR